MVLLCRHHIRSNNLSVAELGANPIHTCSRVVFSLSGDVLGVAEVGNELTACIVGIALRNSRLHRRHQHNAVWNSRPVKIRSRRRRRRLDCPFLPADGLRVGIHDTCQRSEDGSAADCNIA